MAYQSMARPGDDYWQGYAYSHYRPAAYQYWAPERPTWPPQEGSNLTMYLAAITRDSNGVPRGKMAHHLAELVQFPELKALLEDVVICLQKAPQRTLLVSEIGVTISEESRALLRLLKLRILQVLRFFPERFSIVGVGAGSSITLSSVAPPGSTPYIMHDQPLYKGPSHPAAFGHQASPKHSSNPYPSPYPEHEDEPLATEHCSSSSSGSLASLPAHGFQYPTPPPPRFASMLRGRDPCEEGASGSAATTAALTAAKSTSHSPSPSPSPVPSPPISASPPPHLASAPPFGLSPPDLWTLPGKLDALPTAQFPSTSEDEPPRKSPDFTLYAEGLVRDSDLAYGWRASF